MCVFFFFSSRRRHTRFDCDWSSDVCSSDLETHALVGLEALLRWRRQDGSFVPPDRFIPVAEHSGLIVPLGQWVLATACRTMRELLDAGRAPRRMAVNVSTVQLQDPGFLQTVSNALAEHGLQGAQLELEITESVAVLPTQLLQATLSALRTLGVTIAIDDFGTGYSSLSYLERLPLDRIKIDRSFVRQLGESQEARIAEMIAQLGRKLRSEEHTSELQSQSNLVCRLLLEKKKQRQNQDRRGAPPGRSPRLDRAARAVGPPFAPGPHPLRGPPAVQLDDDCGRRGRPRARSR